MPTLSYSRSNRLPEVSEVVVVVAEEERKEEPREMMRTPEREELNEVEAEEVVAEAKALAEVAARELDVAAAAEVAARVLDVAVEAAEVELKAPDEAVVVEALVLEDEAVAKKLKPAESYDAGTSTVEALEENSRISMS